ncbi:casein kinase 1-like protein 3, partial [Cenococcum geophilum]
QGLKAETQGLKEELILEKKETTSIQELCESLPEEFAMYFKHVRSLSFNQTTNYGYLHDLFSKLLRRKGYEYDHVFDIAELKFLERRRERRKI